MTDVFSHPWLSGLFSDSEMQEILSPQVQLHHMLAVEAAFSRALGKVDRVPEDIAERAAMHITAAQPDIEQLQKGTASDGLAVPTLVRNLKEGCPEVLHPAIHTGLTSQDVIDTAKILSLKVLLPILDDRLSMLSNFLTQLEKAQGTNKLMGRTRMQAAMPITVTDRLRSWHLPLADHRERLEQLKPRLLCLQLGGAAGDRAALGPHAQEIAVQMAKDLGLENPVASWHSRRDAIVEFSNWLSLVSGTLGKMGQDVSLMAQQGVDDIALKEGGGSSAMPHKQNPVLAELLVTLARFNAVQISGMHQALVHEQERSGAAWTLEWMILPQMIVATGRALNAGLELLNQVDRIGSPT
ncbi:3-carboxy-cis,cis-muconate cycloisomerase [Ruegeria sp. SCP11]|uniref:3-carboxy-cis,cis-muconate cycloisomerase n=1 Tax=Ruegeria sp. SCP11 TaxID=3141378 RepID=UPI0033393DBA